MADEYEDTYDDGAEEGVYDEDGFENEEGDVIVDPTAGGPKPSSETQALLGHHPEIWVDYSETIYSKLADPNRVCYPFLTQFEKTKVLSFRASQLNKGSMPYIEVPDDVTDVYTIAKLELKNKRLPFIIKRPLPDGDYEFWRLTELMLLD
jgi:DNA-directed RNA polymerase I, II, and III subunit RPABC2